MPSPGDLRHTSDYELEQEQALAKAREREASGEIRQCNEGRYPFRFVEDDGAGNVQVQCVSLAVLVQCFSNAVVFSRLHWCSVCGLSLK